MKLGVFVVLFGSLSFEAALDRAVEAGLQCVEIGSGLYPGNTHCDPQALLADQTALAAFRHAVESRGLEISALSCHGNPLHPQPALARESHQSFLHTVMLAERLGVGCVNLFSGCPGDSDSSRYPNWVTCAWPTEYLELLEWQWRDKAIPYWREQAAFAAAHHVRLGFEMHPGFLVYNPPTLLRLRAACGETVGANLDPSHFFWQGIDIVTAIEALGREGAIFHVHAKDTAIIVRNASLAGVLDTTPLGEIGRRSWLYRTVGYGHGELEWREILSALRTVGYDGVISIEHEDALLSLDEGFRRAVEFLQRSMPTEPAVIRPWWT